MIVPDLSVAENVLLGNEPDRAGFSIRGAKRSAQPRRSSSDSASAQASIRRRAAGRLSTAQKQIVEIARALALRAPVIIMDEPTAALSEREASRPARGSSGSCALRASAILFVSHRLDEVRGIADRITVLRGGRRIATLDASRVTDTGELISLMVGRPISELFPPRNRRRSRCRPLGARSCTRSGVFEDIDFDVRAGEVLGFAGLVGAGRTESMRAIFGADRPTAARFRKAAGARRSALRATPSPPASPTCPRIARMHGLVLLQCRGPRTWHGLAGSIRPARARLMARDARAAARAIAGRLQFRGQLASPARDASGGNQQKLVIGKWVLSGARRADLRRADARHRHRHRRPRSIVSSTSSPPAARPSCWSRPSCPS